MIFHRSLFLLTIFRVAISVANAQGDYGVDCSWPIHSEEFKCGDLLGDREAVYDEYMEGCRQKWGKKGAARCDSNEGDRVEMSLRQPQSMFVSYCRFR
jgi:prolyl 4-hydroxylase